MEIDVQQNTFWKELILSNPLPTILFRFETGEIVFVNNAFTKLYGYSKEKLTGINITKIRPKSEVDFILRKIKSLKPGESYNTFAHHRTRYNDNLCVDIHLRSFENEDGKVVVAVIKDITEQIRLQNRLEAVELNYKMLIEHSRDLILILTQDGNLMMVSPACKQFIGYSPEEMTCRSLYDFIDRSNIAFLNLFMNNLQPGKSHEGHLLFKKKNGDSVLLKCNSSLLPDVENSKMKIMMIFKNFEEVVKEENKNDNIPARSDDIQHLKSIILANLTHEFRTPLVGILGYAEILGNEITDPELKEMIDEVREDGQRLLTSLSLVINLSALETGNIKIFKTLVNIGDIVLKVVHKFETFAKKKKLYINFFPKEQNFALRIDKDLLFDALYFIVDNGLKYTEYGGISINIDYCDKGGKKCCKIEIVDTGIGIPEDKQKTIFEAFRQISEGDSRSFEGLGLGLTVAQKIINMIGGEINFTSKVNKGTTFRIIFPVEE